VYVCVRHIVFTCFFFSLFVFCHLSLELSNSLFLHLCTQGRWLWIGLLGATSMFAICWHSQAGGLQRRRLSCTFSLTQQQRELFKSTYVHNCSRCSCCVPYSFSYVSQCARSLLEMLQKLLSGAWIIPETAQHRAGRRRGSRLLCTSHHQTHVTGHVGECGVG
jgi:hypothetical protein